MLLIVCVCVRCVQASKIIIDTHRKLYRSLKIRANFQFYNIPQYYICCFYRLRAASTNNQRTTNSKSFFSYPKRNEKKGFSDILTIRAQHQKNWLLLLLLFFFSTAFRTEFFWKDVFKMNKICFVAIATRATATEKKKLHLSLALVCFHQFVLAHSIINIEIDIDVINIHLINLCDFIFVFIVVVVFLWLSAIDQIGLTTI